MKVKLFIVLIMVLGIADLARAASSPLIEEDKVLPYLEQVIAWQRQVTSLETTGTGREILLKEALTQGATNVLKASFDFARSQAQIIDKQNSATSATDQDSDHAHLVKAAASVDQHIGTLDGQVTVLSAQIAKTRLSKRAPLTAQLNDLQSQLKFAEAQHDLIGNVLGVFNSMSVTGDSGMLGKVNSLASTAVPADKPASAASAAKPSAKDETAPQSRGLLTMTEDLFQLWRERDEVQSLNDAANDLRKTDKGFQDAARQEIKSAIQKGTALSQPPQQGQPAAAAVPGNETLDDLLTDFKQLSAAVVPLTQVNVSLDSSLHALEQWTTAIHDEMAGLLRALSLRLAVLGVFLLIPIALSEATRRATDRYVKDDKRQKQLRSLRRALVTVVIVIIILLNLVNEIGSIATFAGVITAGLAVAFQNVLLSIVAHFFFYGRYSVRVGDRVSVSGVIGDIVYVGVVRFYMREMEEHDGELKATGRVAAFPNSILFQTSAFFKYVDAPTTSGENHAKSDVERSPAGRSA